MTIAKISHFLNNSFVFDIESKGKSFAQTSVILHGMKHLKWLRELFHVAFSVVRDVHKFHLKTKRRLLYLKTQIVPRSKHFSSRL